MQNISGVYSKGRTNNTHEWDESNETKASRATLEQRQAAKQILQPYYDVMEKFAAKAQQ